MKAYKTFRPNRLLQFLILLPLPFILNAQKKHTITDTVTGDQINFFSSDLKNSKIILGNQTEYSGLDSSQIHKLDSLRNTVALISSQIEKFDITKEMSFFIRKINALKRINDSILQNQNGLEKYKQKLNNEYNNQLKQAYADYWEQNPDFNPYDQAQCIALIEKLNGERPDSIDEYAILNIPKHGPTSIMQLRTKYRDYWSLIDNKPNIDVAIAYFARYRKNLDCDEPYGTIIINNNLNEDVNFSFKGYNSNDGCTAAKKSVTTLQFFINTYKYEAYLLIKNNNQKEYKGIQSGTFILYACGETIINID